MLTNWITRNIWMITKSGRLWLLSKTELMRCQKNKIGKKKWQKNGTRLMLMKQLIFHVKNCRLTLIKRVKFPTVSKINKSHNTVHCLLESGATNASKMSYSQRVKEAKKKEAEARPDWDASTTGERKNISTEDKVAAKIAAEVLRDNAKLRAVHSGPSIKKLLEREAKK